MYQCWATAMRAFGGDECYELIAAADVRIIYTSPHQCGVSLRRCIHWRQHASSNSSSIISYLNKLVDRIHTLKHTPALLLSFLNTHAHTLPFITTRRLTGCFLDSLVCTCSQAEGQNSVTEKFFFLLLLFLLIPKKYDADF